MADKKMTAQITVVDIEEPPSRQTLNDGDSINTLFGKIKKVISDLKAVAFSGSYTDLTDRPTDILTGGSQTATSSADGGSNVFTFTKSDGTTAAFTVKNGSKGEKGEPGKDGTAGAVPTIKAAAGANINAVGTPSVTAATSGSTTTFTFNNLKGAKGDKGDPGTNATTTSVATQSANGLFSAADKKKLDGIAAGANAVTKVSQLTNDSGYLTANGTILAATYATYGNTAQNTPSNICLRNMSMGTAAASSSNCTVGSWYGQYS